MFVYISVKFVKITVSNLEIEAQVIVCIYT